MAGPTRDFGELESRVREFRDARDWARFHRPRELAASIAIEAAELLEHFQWKTDAECAAYLEQPENRAALARELADVQMLLLSAADALDTDLHAVTLEKIEENARKYPVDRARGRADKYDRL